MEKKTRFNDSSDEDEVIPRSELRSPGIGGMEERRDKQSHGKEEAVSQESWRHRQTGGDETSSDH